MLKSLRRWLQLPYRTELLELQQRHADLQHRYRIIAIKFSVFQGRLPTDDDTRGLTVTSRTQSEKTVTEILGWH